MIIHPLYIFPNFSFNFDKLNVWDVDWEYMLGNSLLVAPVMEEASTPSKDS